MMRFNKIHIVFALFFFSGCAEPSLKEYVSTVWTGRSVEALREADSRNSYDDAYKAKIGWKETTYKLDNGNWVYVEFIRLARKDYYIHRKVNPEGIIIGSTVRKTPDPPAKQ